MATSVSEIENANEVPEKIGKYVIINKIGRGSTGDVYLSHDPYYRRDVAIKVYSIEEDSDADRAKVSRKMFFNEAHMVGMLQHPNIMPIYDAGEEDGKYYVVTEHIQGARTLAAYCRPDNLLRVDDVVEIIYKCAKALHYAHGRGVIHRDIKPSNVMLTIDNDVRIIDFIDMKNPEHRKLLVKKMREFMKNDTAQHTVLSLSRFGLMQITRQRVRPEVKINTSEVCPTCNGTVHCRGQDS